MKLRILGALAATGLAAGVGAAAEPAKLMLPEPTTAAPAVGSVADQVANQKLADAVAARMTKGMVSGADLSIFASGGVVTMTGTVKDEVQKADLLKVASTTDGVSKVRDGLKAGAVKQAQSIGGPLATSAVPPPALPPGVNPDIEPLPLGPAGGGMAGGAPPLPPHSWPTYAPYNNVSRVAYPTAYPYNAFPFIGPFYPYPKIPLGWRQVTLSWEDGSWYLGRKQAPVDYWRVRFW